MGELIVREGGPDGKYLQILDLQRLVSLHLSKPKAYIVIKLP